MISLPRKQLSPVPMLLSVISPLLIALPGAFAALVVDVAPDTPQPYVIPNLKGTAFDFGGLILRTLVANSTSQGSLSILGVNAGPSALGLIHSHQEVEGFYALKGSVQVFQDYDTGRELRAGDFTLLAPAHNHSYRPNDLDFQLSLCMAPGGIDQFFATTGAPYNTSGPFNPEGYAELDLAKVVAAMPKYNITPAPNNSINWEWVNGTTEEGLDIWRIADQALPEDSDTAYFIASNHGPKFLHRESGSVVAQLATGQQTNDKLSMATITLKPGNKGASVTFDSHQAFQVVEGQLSLKINGETSHLIFGDLAFIPKGTSFSYWSSVGFTEFLLWAAPGPGLAESLVNNAEPWVHAIWPAT